MSSSTTSFLFVLLLVAATGVLAQGEGGIGCTGAADQLAVLSQRSRFTWALDSYIRGFTGAAQFERTIRALFSPTFSSTIVSSPAGTSTYVGITATVNWLLALPTSTFNGFSDHRIVNPIITPLDNPCFPEQIELDNYSPNLFELRLGVGESLLVSEISTEKWVYTKSGLLNPQWLIHSYFVNSTIALDSAAIDINIYAGGVPAKKK